MPVYEYKCTVCEEHMDVEQSFSDDTLKTIPGCEVDPKGKHRVKKVFSAVGISFKGDGFYRNDARGGSSSSSSSSSESGSGSSSASETKSKASDSKSDSGSDSKSDSGSGSGSSSKKSESSSGSGSSKSSSKSSS